MFKTKRRKELEAKEEELALLKTALIEMGQWCASDSSEIAFAVDYVLNRRVGISGFRDKLRRGFYTFDNYKKIESDKCFMLFSADFEEALINHPKLKEEYNGSSD